MAPPAGAAAGSRHPGTPAPLLLGAASLLFASSLAAPAAAIVNPGDQAPGFTKNELDYPSFGQVTPRTLADYSGKVIVFFLLGYS